MKMLAAVSLALLNSCAKTGEPHPPVVVVPKAPVDLAARQYSNKILLVVTAPTENTDGSTVSAFGSVEVWRETEDRNSAAASMSDASYLAGAEKILTIPGDKIASFQHGSALMLRDELSLPDPTQVYSESFRYAVRFLNRKKQSAGLSNQAVVAPVPIPSAPAGLSFEVTQDFIGLKWPAPTENMNGTSPARIEGYNVYRTEDPKNFPPAPLNQGLLQKPEFEDRSFEFDKTYYYSVSIVGSKENPYAESSPSEPLKVLPRDTFPPGAPQNLNAVEAGPAILLLWAAPPERDIAGYRIYRKEEADASPRLLRQELLRELSYRDENVQKGRKYVYRVTAVDTHGNEGRAAETELEVR